MIGHPAEPQTDGNVEKGWQLLLQNHHLSLRMMGDDLDTSKDTVQKIVIENVKKRKVCLCFVPHALTAEHEEDKVAACQNFIEMAHNNPNFKKNHNWQRILVLG